MRGGNAHGKSGNTHGRDAHVLPGSALGGQEGGSEGQA